MSAPRTPDLPSRRGMRRCCWPGTRRAPSKGSASTGRAPRSGARCRSCRPSLCRRRICRARPWTCPARTFRGGSSRPHTASARRPRPRGPEGSGSGPIGRARRRRRFGRRGTGRHWSHSPHRCTPRRKRTSGRRCEGRRRSLHGRRSGSPSQHTWGPPTPGRTCMRCRRPNRCRDTSNHELVTHTAHPRTPARRSTRHRSRGHDQSSLEGRCGPSSRWR